jgi:hypothetical protein
VTNTPDDSPFDMPELEEYERGLDFDDEDDGGPAGPPDEPADAPAEGETPFESPPITRLPLDPD